MTPRNTRKVEAKAPGTWSLVQTRIDAETYNELITCAKASNRSVAGEVRAILQQWRERRRVRTEPAPARRQQRR